jgi:hypothetical protein
MVFTFIIAMYKLFYATVSNRKEIIRDELHSVSCVERVKLNRAKIFHFYNNQKVLRKAELRRQRI